MARRSEAVVSIAAACAAGARRASAQTTPPIRFGCSPAGESFYLPIYAQEEGEFRRAGLNVELVTFGTSGAIVEAALGNAIDVGLCDIPGAANAYNRGFPIAIFAGGAAYDSDNNGVLLCTLPDSALRTAKDLEGSSIGVVVLASVSSLAVTAWLQAGGADLGKIKMVELPYTTMVAALRRKDIAAAQMAEPVLSQALAGKDVRPIARPFDAIAKRFFISATFSTRQWLAANQPLARRLAAALDNAARWANAHTRETADIVSRGTRIPLEIVNGMARWRFTTLDRALIQPVLDTAYRYKQIPKLTNAADITASV
jgi:NitT/TauT family transport system substrate-binding protein